MRRTVLCLPVVCVASACQRQDPYRVEFPISSISKGVDDLHWEAVFMGDSQSEGNCRAELGEHGDRIEVRIFEIDSNWRTVPGGDVGKYVTLAIVLSSPRGERPFVRADGSVIAIKP